MPTCLCFDGPHELPLASIVKTAANGALNRQEAPDRRPTPPSAVTISTQCRPLRLGAVKVGSRQKRSMVGGDVKTIGELSAWAIVQR